jgi:hypothetical protein
VEVLSGHNVPAYFLSSCWPDSCSLKVNKEEYINLPVFGLDRKINKNNEKSLHKKGSSVKFTGPSTPEADDMS